MGPGGPAYLTFVLNLLWGNTGTQSLRIQPLESDCLWVQIPALLLPNCITLGKSLNLSEPQFPIFKRGLIIGIAS